MPYSTALSCRCVSKGDLKRYILRIRHYQKLDFPMEFPFSQQQSCLNCTFKNTWHNWVLASGRWTRWFILQINTLLHLAVHHVPRIDRKGGGVCLINQEGFSVNSIRHRTFSRLKTLSRLIAIHRPPSSTENKLTVNMFKIDFCQLLD